MIAFCEPCLPATSIEAVIGALSERRIGSGPYVAEFAQAICDGTGSDFALPVTSGTVALMVAAKAVGLIAGDEVIVPAYGVAATANAFKCLGMRVRFADIDRETGCLTVETVRAAHTSRTRAVCFVNFSGCTPEAIFEISQLCDDLGLVLIEDAACALGHAWRGKYAGTFGRASILSFSVPKLVTTGQGGAVLFRRADDYEWARDVIDQGDADRTGNIRHEGANFRMTDIQAALGLAQLREIDALKARKKVRYETISEQAELYRTLSGTPLHNILFTNDPDRVVMFLTDRGIEARRQYGVMTDHEIYRDGAGEFPNARWWAEHAVYLPFGLGMSVQDAEEIAKAL